MEKEETEDDMKFPVNLCSLDSPTDKESTSKVNVTTIKYTFDKESHLLKKEAELSRRESLLRRREKLLDQAWTRFNVERDQWFAKKRKPRSSLDSSSVDNK